MYTIDKIIHSRRKTIALEITSEAKLIVRAPYATPLSSIKSIVAKKQVWIQRIQKKIATRMRQAAPKQFATGEQFLFMGKNYPLLIGSQKKPLLLFTEKGFILSEGGKDEGRDIFIQWYKRQAKEIISQRVQYYAQRTSIPFTRITITKAQKRWGSCSSKSNLNFSWRLIMAPPAVINYVVVHELVHVLEKNHQKSFWEKVAQILPDYKSYRKWLRENGHILQL